ncbi:zinc finger protein 653 isoform X2 [Sphaeramia orbicularis]|uniref:Zinc finger protein 653 n=1 Tax=Sphaeramia orbicularis TaxID=375764 RepID=A0A672YGY9_9TELE|nr:zinc finger protein 653-like isoform X1 [Sphaeramia orbicularis]XP_029998212.1 zinc finger protein 653-like isoform X2 [Sphaeramia orbicularis]
MAQVLSDLEVPLDADQTGEEGKGGFRRCRGRPRLTDSDRAQRRLESRKKYDVRRVYLGESHKLWSELRRRTSLSDAGLAEYLILLNSTYGDKYQQKYCGKKISPDIPASHKKGRKDHVSSLHTLVCWYQEHSCSCPHEPQLKALEPQPNFSTAAIWQCDSNHSFVQYLYSPQREASDSEHEEGMSGEGDGETLVANTAVAKGPAGRTRRRNAHKQIKDLEENVDVSGVQRTAVSPDEQATALNHEPRTETSSRDSALTGQPIWDMGMVTERRQESPGPAFQPLTSEDDCEDLRQSREGEGERCIEEEIRTVSHGYECVTVTASLSGKLGKTDEDSMLSQDLSSSVPPPMQVQNQSELFDPQTLQTVITSCELPDQRTALEGSQLIIITGPSYEALASEGIQLNMGGASVEEVTCTVIGGVTYNQVCTSDTKIRSAEDEDPVTDLSDKQLLQPSVDSPEHSDDRELQRSLSSVRSKRNRRGPVIEADGMLKMFHCPYEGCSQVYVAISSFQNHVNLVHRKGRTKVCPHPGCGKKFYLSNHLHRHMIIHSGVRDFICETCGKSFKRKNHLEVHRRTHTGETPLQCEICGYQCRQRASLNWHMKKHTSEAHYNFTCELCDKRFEKLDSVKFHKLKSHPDKQAT